MSQNTNEDKSIVPDLVKQLIKKMPKPTLDQVLSHPGGGTPLPLPLIYMSHIKDEDGNPILTETNEDRMKQYAQYGRGAFIRVKADENGEPACFLIDAATGVETLMTTGPQDLNPTVDYIHQLLFRDRVRIDPVMVYDRSQGSSLNRRYSSTIQNIIVGPRRPGAYWPKEKKNYMSASAKMEFKLSDEDMKDIVHSHDTLLKSHLPKPE